MMSPLTVIASTPHIPPRGHSYSASSLAHWPDAIIILVLGGALFVASYRVDVRARHLDENRLWDIDERKGAPGLERLRGIRPVEVGLLLSPQAAVLTTVAALVERGVLTPAGPGFIPTGSLAEPQNTLESAVLAQFTQTRGQGVSMTHLLANPSIISALNELRSSMAAKHLVRGMSPRVAGLINLAGLTLFLVVALGLMAWHEWKPVIPLATLPTTVGGILLLICTVSAFRDPQWVTPGVDSALGMMRMDYHFGVLPYSTRGGGYRETGVSPVGANAFTRFWGRQSVDLNLEREDLPPLLATHPFSAPKKPWPDGV